MVETCPTCKGEQYIQKDEYNKEACPTCDAQGNILKTKQGGNKMVELRIRINKVENKTEDEQINEILTSLGMENISELNIKR